ncbi:MAG: ATP-dependent Lon protease [Thermoleophilaceae bacterium]|nr:ATP-dependent Lon protease [Thermoleophilaceae bacterium]
MSIHITQPDGDPLELELGSALPKVLPVLPLKDSVPFPDTLTPLAVGQDRSVQLVNEVLGGDRMLVMVASKNPELDTPGREDLYRVGVAGVVARMLKVPDGTLRILVQGGQRVRLDDFVASEPYLVARIEPLPDVVKQTPELEALFRNVQSNFLQIIEKSPYLPEELQLAVANLEDPAELAHMIAGALRMKTEERQELLEERDLQKRLRRLSELLARELEVLEIGGRIQSQVQSELEKGQREYFLRQQMKAIQEELGEVDEIQAESNELREQIESANLPEDVRKAAERELQRFERMPPQSAEHGVIRGYLEWIVSLPWQSGTEDHLDLKAARKQLDKDHYDIEKVKDRILEFLAVRTLKPDARSSILCFVGPPGVGKTSLGRSIAEAMGRNFQRISVGGVRDESEIRGHRRTYVGAMPGTILRAMRDAGANNPVLMIDEIDKMGSDFRGDPSSAMLEVLDPEQNTTFRDHYLDLPYDLSHVMFITTANELERIPGALRDRMEIIQLAGYTQEEKLQIAKRYLVPRQIERNGLTPARIEFTDEALVLIIDGYTREAGVRNLEREIGAVCRKVAREWAEGSRKRKLAVRPKQVAALLGRRRHFRETLRRTQIPGVATGLAWTPVGGEVLFVEATAFPGEGKMQITGQLGDVMKESAAAAFSWAKGHVHRFGEVPDDWFSTHDVHVHVPAGAIPKDGPSAGVAMATALTSLITGRNVRADTAMTGEITLVGQVLPIGGLKEKALAAQQAGIKRVVAPAFNEPDIDDIPEHLRKKIDFLFVANLDKALAETLDPVKTSTSSRRTKPAPSSNGRSGNSRPSSSARSRKKPAGSRH